MSRTDLDLAKRVAMDVADGNVSARDLAFCIAILIGEIEELKKKVMEVRG
jgi:hypothetical protein